MTFEIIVYIITYPKITIYDIFVSIYNNIIYEADLHLYDNNIIYLTINVMCPSYEQILWYSFSPSRFCSNQNFLSQTPRTEREQALGQ